MVRTPGILVASLLLFSATDAVGKQDPRPLKLHATVVTLPRGEHCNDKLLRTTVLYRVERVVEGSYPDRTILVVHRCPELARGPARIGRGDAGPIRVGQTHLLELRPIDPQASFQVMDPFVDDKRPRFKPLRTDPSDWPPRMVVVVKGGGGTHLKLPFDAGELSVGRGADNDVMLGGPGLSSHHLRLVVVGKRVEVQPLGAARVTLNGKAMTGPARITFRDRVGLGPYTLRIALFLDGKDH